MSPKTMALGMLILISLASAGCMYDHGPNQSRMGIIDYSFSEDTESTVLVAWEEGERFVLQLDGTRVTQLRQSKTSWFTGPQTNSDGVTGVIESWLVDRGDFGDLSKANEGKAYNSSILMFGAQGEERLATGTMISAFTRVNDTFYIARAAADNKFSSLGVDLPQQARIMKYEAGYETQVVNVTFRNVDSLAWLDEHTLIFDEADRYDGTRGGLTWVNVDSGLHGRYENDDGTVGGTRHYDVCNFEGGLTLLEEHIYPQAPLNLWMFSWHSQSWELLATLPWGAHDACLVESRNSVLFLWAQQYDAVTYTSGHQLNEMDLITREVRAVYPATRSE